MVLLDMRLEAPVEVKPTFTKLIINIYLCIEIKKIARFLEKQKSTKSQISEWHILAAVLDRILLIIFTATFFTGSFYFYSEIGKHPVPEHPFASWSADPVMRASPEYNQYRWFMLEMTSVNIS